MSRFGRNRCIDCGTRIGKDAIRCHLCAAAQTENVERNSRLTALYRAGETLEDLAWLFKISVTRVRAIVKREEWRAK